MDELRQGSQLNTEHSPGSENKIGIPMFKMSLCAEADQNFQNGCSEDLMESSLNENEEPGEDVRFLSASRNSIFSRFSEISFKKFQKDYQFIFVIISFLMFFISGLFFGAILVKMFLCEKGNFDLKNLNGTITLSEQFDLML